MSQPTCTTQFTAFSLLSKCGCLPTTASQWLQGPDLCCMCALHVISLCPSEPCSGLTGLHKPRPPGTHHPSRLEVTDSLGLPTVWKSGLQSDWPSRPGVVAPLRMPSTHKESVCCALVGAKHAWGHAACIGWLRVMQPLWEPVHGLQSACRFDDFQIALTECNCHAGSTPPSWAYLADITEGAGRARPSTTPGELNGHCCHGRCTALADAAVKHAHHADRAFFGA